MPALFSVKNCFCEFYVFRLICIIIVPLGGSACTTSEWNVPVVAANTQIADIERVFVATMRAPTNRNEMRFSSERADRLHFADIDVSVPKQRKVGKLIGPTDVPDPSREFGAVRVDSFDDETAFVEAINREMLKRPPKERVAFVFVHGYNTKFGESVYRHAQLRKDYNVRAVPVTYSWPSAGKLQGYLYDRDSAQYARDGLIRTLKLLQRSKARSTFIVAHSMGTLLTMETLRQASISGDKQLLRSVGALVLAAPDIDNDVFKEQVGKIDPLPDPFVMFVSSKDQALRASQLVRRGTPRVGEGEEIATWQSLGITVVDLSNVPDGGLTKHGVYASSPTLIRIIQDEGLNLAMLGQDRSDYPQAQAADSGARFAENVVHFPTNE